MNSSPRSIILPSAFVAYVAMISLIGAPGSAGQHESLSSLTQLLLLASPLAVAWGLRRLNRAQEANHLATDLDGLRWTLLGVAISLTALPATIEQPGLRAIGCVGHGMAVAGALLSMAGIAPPPGLLQGHPAARARDAVWASLVLWTLSASIYALRALFPDRFPLDPITLDTVTVFSGIGSLLLLGASILRVRVLRGLEMGVGDRAQAALSIAVAGIVVAAAAGFVRLAPPGRVVSVAANFVAVGAALAAAYPSAALLSRFVRGLTVLLVVGTPTVLGGIWLIQSSTMSRELLLATFILLGMSQGLLAKRLARPLAPEGSRWLDALDNAMQAALVPDPDQAIVACLIALRKAEPTSKERPEIFRLDPPAIISVDIAGYASEKKAEFPGGIVEGAEGEPHATLRYETLRAAQVRYPQSRPLLTWFEAHRAQAVSVLKDGAEPIGLLVLPRGKRTSALSVDETERLGNLAQRLSGLLGVTSSLRRARHREVGYQRSAAQAELRAQELETRLQSRKQSDQREAEARVEVLRATAHGPAAQIKLQELEQLSRKSPVFLVTQVGVDPVPWAAHLHMQRFSDPRPLVVVDFRSRAHRDLAAFYADEDISPAHRSREGTLVLLHPSALTAQDQQRLADILATTPPIVLVTCAASTEGLDPALARMVEGPTTTLPTLSERGEDMQSIIINELSQLGLTQRGRPYGIDRSALADLLERSFSGNDDELKGILAALAGRCSGDRISRQDVAALFGIVESELPPKVDTPRRRHRVAPRARRH